MAASPPPSRLSARPSTGGLSLSVCPWVRLSVWAQASCHVAHLPSSAPSSLLPSVPPDISAPPLCTARGPVSSLLPGLVFLIRHLPNTVSWKEKKSVSRLTYCETPGVLPFRSEQAVAGAGAGAMAGAGRQPGPPWGVDGSSLAVSMCREDTFSSLPFV